MILIDRLIRKRKDPPIITTPKAQEIIDLILELENTSAGFSHKKVAVQLNLLCLSNPRTVAALILDDDSGLNELRRERLLFRYSIEQFSCRLSDNPRWVAMVRQFIIPQIDQLPPSWRQQLEWHQEVYGL